MDRVGGVRVTIQWNSVAGMRYAVERTTRLDVPFAPIATNIAATPPLNTFVDTPGRGAAYFYRVGMAF